jgi:hypothetical protein
VRRAGEEDIARLDGHHPRRETHHLAAVEDHVVGVPVLPLLAVDPAFKAHVVGIPHEVARDQVRTERGEAVERLADHELAC